MSRLNTSVPVMKFGLYYHKVLHFVAINSQQIVNLSSAKNI